MPILQTIQLPSLVISSLYFPLSENEIDVSRKGFIHIMIIGEMFRYTQRYHMV